MSDTEQTCAFSIPHEDKFNYLYQAIYAPVAIEAGLTPLRVLDFGRRSEAIEEAWEASTSHVAVVDLTNACGQPFYYLALRQLQGKPTILTSQSLDDVPIPFRSLPTIEYQPSESRWDKRLRKELLAAIEAVLKDPASAVFNPLATGELDATNPENSKVMGWTENESPDDSVEWKMGFHTFIEEARKHRDKDKS
jgi:hypothetical protein